MQTYEMDAGQNIVKFNYQLFHEFLLFNIYIFK